MSKKTARKKTPELWTTSEKLEKCLEIMKKLKDFNLKAAFPKEIEDLQSIINEYIRNNKEYTGSIRLPGTQRLMVIKLRNNKKWPPEVVLSFQPKGC